MKYKKQKGKGLSQMISGSINPGPFSPPIQRLPWWNQSGYGINGKYIKKRLRSKKPRQKGGILGRLMVRMAAPQLFRKR